MTCAYLGGSAGSWLGVHAYSQTGWQGVCALVALLAALALARHLVALYGQRPRFNEDPATSRRWHPRSALSHSGSSRWPGTSAW
jgi:sugar phosphate permease